MEGLGRWGWNGSERGREVKVWDTKRERDRKRMMSGHKRRQQREKEKAKGSIKELKN